MLFRRILRIAAVLCSAASSLALTASAQITVNSPANGAQNLSMPVQLSAQVSSCDGNSTITAFGYSIDSSPFITWANENSAGTGITNTIDTYDYRIVPGSHTIRFKAWSDAGECPEADSDITVNGYATTMISNVNDLNPNAPNDGNAPNWDPGECGTAPYSPAPDLDWYWVWDNGTAGCTLGGDNTNSYLAPSGSPNTIDGEARLYYLTWQDQNYGNSGAQDPAERYSIDYYQGATTADYFVYDTYMYITDPQNLFAVQMDTNWVNPSGNVTILGFLCVNNGASDSTWEFTTVNSSGSTIWNDPTQHQPGWTQAPCNPQQWTTSATPNGWHHVQLAGHRFECSSSDTTGTCVNYDSITLDGNSTDLSNWYGYSTFAGPWNPGDVVLNYELYGVPNGGDQASATVYTDGMTMINWTAPLSTTQ
jgi:hypothetical protein